MSRYSYIAKSQPQKTVQGRIEAESEQEAVNKLTKMGYFPISIRGQELSVAREGILRLRKISKREMVLFTRQLSSLLDSGVNILNGLNIISAQTPNRHLAAILDDVVSKIKDGKSLSESMASHPYLFSGLYTSMVHSGEVGGNLEQVLKRLAEFLEKQEEFKDSLRTALIYPFFIFVVGVLTVAVLLGFVIPRLVTIFEDMGQVLPAPTRILIGLSGFLRAYGWLILIVIITLVFLARRLYSSPQGKTWWDGFKLKGAIWGQLILKAEISRLMQTLSLLLASGIPITHSLDISTAVLENQIIRQEAQKFKDKITGGLSLSGCLKASKLFPLLVANVVAVAEETGTLEKSLLRIADDYEREVGRTLQALTRLLEPVIILIMGLIVGFIVLSMLLPVFQISIILR